MAPHLSTLCIRSPQNQLQVGRHRCQPCFSRIKHPDPSTFCIWIRREVLYGSCTSRYWCCAPLHCSHHAVSSPLVGWQKLAPCKLIVHVLLEDTSRNGASVNQRSLNSQVRYSVRLTTRLTFMEIHQLVQSRKIFQVV
jgi:hypothetical protein